LDCKSVDKKLERMVNSILMDFECDHDRLPDIEPEPWYADTIAMVLGELGNAHHVICEEISGLYEFGWPWEESTAKWIAELEGVLHRLPK
jgi:hypothetical protein